MRILSIAHILRLGLDMLFPKTAREREIETLTPQALASKLVLEEAHGTLALFSYRDPLIREMIWLLKYKKNARAAQLFATVLHDYLAEELSDATAFGEGRICIVPLPLSWRRKQERGFNQMVLVTDELKKLGEYEVVDALKRTHRKPQTSLKRKSERVENMKGVFTAQKAEAVRNAHVILLDDVLTTGSTLREAKRALKDAGVRRVSAIALAH